MNEETFHLNRIAFIIYNGEVKYLKNSTLGHKEWCSSLGIDDNEFNNLVRGYIYKGDIVFYSGDFKYDERVINVATDYFKKIALDNGLVKYSVYCGVQKGKQGEIWPPILKIK